MAPLAASPHRLRELLYRFSVGNSHISSVRPPTHTRPLCADPRQDTLIIRVVTECGLEGYGEVEAQPEVAKAIVDAPKSWGGAKIGASGLRAQLVGEAALDTERLWEKMYTASSFYGRHAVVIQAMAGIDMALHDIKGKFLQLPLYQLLGGKVCGC